MSLLMWVLIAGLAKAQSQTPTIEMKIEPQVLSSGQTTVLSWKVTGGDKVFISQFGKVGVAGQEQIKPNETTIYSLIAEGPEGVATRSITVEVSGTKGDDEFPEEENFKYQLSYKTTAPSLPEFLDYIHYALQDSMQFSLKEYHDDAGKVVFRTNISQRGYLVEGQEKKIGARGIAYWIELTEQKSSTNEFNYLIKTLIKYRLKLERTWRVEDNEALYQQEARRLQALMNKRPTTGGIKK